MRPCIKCFQEKNEEDFTPNQNRCKVCTANYMKAYSEKRIAQNAEKGTFSEGQLLICTNCSEEKDCSLFSRNRSKKFGRESVCKACTYLKQGKTYQANKEKGPELEGTKECTKCHLIFPMTYFTPAPLGKSGRSAQCQECLRLRYKLYRENAAYQEKASTRAKVTYEERKAEFYTWLSTKSCVECGERDFRKLEFDHLRDKKFGIAQAVGKVKAEILFEEVAKCDIICSNCHKVRTALRGDYYSYISWYDKETYNPNSL